MQLGRQAGVDGRLARPRVEDEGVGALAADADVDGLGDLPGHGAHGERHPFGAPGQNRGAAAPGGGGGRAKVTLGSTRTVPWCEQRPPAAHHAQGGRHHDGDEVSRRPVHALAG